MDVYCLRVRKESAGKVFPFDRVYLAENGKHLVFKQMFRYALVMPVEAELKGMLKEYVKIDKGDAHPFHRDDTALPPTHENWSELLDATDWVMAVPVLPKYMKGNMPRYLTAAGRYRVALEENGGKPVRPYRQKKGVRVPAIEDPFPSLTYLQTPEQNIRPVCIACPRFILHEQGHCRLGEPICYTSLALGVKNHFEEGLSAPAAPENILTQED